MKAIVYIDGFNLYYGCVKGTPYRWLNMREFAERMLPKDEVVAIKYFTAKIQARPHDQGAPARQATFLRALETLPGMEIFYGKFLTSKITARLVTPAQGGQRSAQVWKTEEKGSDVNLAMHMLVDAFEENCELAVVVSNDGDLKGPIEYVRNVFERPVGVLNPTGRRSYALSPAQLPKGSFYKPIREAVLAKSQFPDEIVDARGAIRKPHEW